MSVALLSPFPLGSTMATWAGLMKTSLSPSWRLNCTRGGTSSGCGGTRGYPVEILGDQHLVLIDLQCLA